MAAPCLSFTEEFGQHLTPYVGHSLQPTQNVEAVADRYIVTVRPTDEKGLGMLGFSSSLQGRVRANFAVPHLLGAGAMARAVKSIEEANRDVEFGPFFEEITAQSSACVMLAVAALEAYANETVINLAVLSEIASPEMVEQLWNDLAWASILAKFEAVNVVMGGEPMAKGNRPYQDVDALIALRNALVHFHPEWEDEQLIHQRVSGALRGRFSPSPFLSSSEPLFPRRWASADCTLWAVRACQEFVASFSRSTRLLDRFAKVASRLP